MARFYRIQIGSIHLSSTGTALGLPCKLEVLGADALLSNFTGSTTVAADGTPINQIFETSGRGRVLEIQIAVLRISVWSSLVALINTALQTAAEVPVVGTGDIGNFAVDCVPLLPKPFEAQNFSGERIKNVVLRFITT